jgi:hypothetical protein
MALLATVVACSSGDEGAGSRFALLDTGVVRDAHTQLVWTASDSGRGLSWLDADRYCLALSSDSEAEEWRLPTIDEIATLYDTAMEQPCGEATICRVDPAIDLSSAYQWSATAPQPNRRFYYDFSFGTRLAPLIRPTLIRGALCTRGEDPRPEQRR